MERWSLKKKVKAFEYFFTLSNLGQTNLRTLHTSKGLILVTCGFTTWYTVYIYKIKCKILRLSMKYLLKASFDLRTKLNWKHAPSNYTYYTVTMKQSDQTKSSSVSELSSQNLDHTWLKYYIHFITRFLYMQECCCPNIKRITKQLFTFNGT